MKKTIQETLDEELKSIVGAAAWYDGLSWETANYTQKELDWAYEKVFEEMLRRAREFGAKDPIIHHNGNGNYVACERDWQK